MRRPLRANVVFDANPLLPPIAALSDDAHISILWDERVDQVDAPRGLMIVSEVQVTTAGEDSVDIARGTDLDGADSVAHVIKGRSFDTSQRHSDGPTVELQRQVVQDNLPIRSRLDRRNRVVAVTIQEGDDGGCDLRPGRQVRAFSFRSTLALRRWPWSSVPRKACPAATARPVASVGGAVRCRAVRPMAAKTRMIDSRTHGGRPDIPGSSRKTVCRRPPRTKENPRGFPRGLRIMPAATYSPTQFPMQYHGRYQA
jgi:hypothetical protein